MLSFYLNLAHLFVGAQKVSFSEKSLRWVPASFHSLQQMTGVSGRKKKMKAQKPQLHLAHYIMRQCVSLFRSSECCTFLLPNWSLPSYKFRSSEPSTEPVCFLVHVEEGGSLCQALLQTKHCQVFSWSASTLSVDLSLPWSLLVVTPGLLSALHTMWYPKLSVRFQMWSAQHREGDILHHHSSAANEQMHCFLKKAHGIHDTESKYFQLNT